MNKKGQLGEILLVFIAVIIGLALIGQVFNTQNLVTEKQSVTNESISLVSAYVGENEVNESVNSTIYSQSDWKKEKCPLTSVSLKDATGTEWTLNTDYLLYADEGVFSVLNTSTTVPSTTSNVTYAYYTYCGDGYNPNSSSRGVAKLWGPFGALIILSAAVYGIRKLF